MNPAKVMGPRRRIGFAASALFLTALTLAALLHAADAEPARTHAVVIENMTFSPAELHVRPGDRVEFENRDLLPHTATAQEPKAFDSSLLKAGESWTLHVPGRPQTIRYVCLYHPTMTGRLIVKQP